MDPFNRPNAEAASLIRLLTSSSVDGTLLPRKTNFSTLSIGVWLRVISLGSFVMILHLAGFIFIPYLLHAISSSLVDVWSFSNSNSIRVVSSAYLMLLMHIAPICIPEFRSYTSFITNYKNKLKRYGDRRQPWRTPIRTSNHSVIFPLTITVHLV